MNLNYIALLIVLFLVNACLLKQEPPKGQPVLNGLDPVEAVINMQDLQTYDEGMSSITASFWHKKATDRKKTSTRQLNIRATQDEVEQLENIIDYEQVEFVNSLGSKISDLNAQMRDGFSPSCEVQHATVSTSEDSSGNDPLQLLSAGVVTFGAALQSGMLALDQDHLGRYKRRLDPRLASGIYQVKVEGSREVPAFSMNVSMPEAFQNVVFLTDPAARGPLNLPKGSSLKMGWKPPTQPNTNTIMIVDVYADLPNEIWRVRCATKESSLINGTPIVLWSIDSQYLDKLPSTQSAQVNLMRAHILGASNEQLEVESQGLRVFLTPATIE